MTVAEMKAKGCKIFMLDTAEAVQEHRARLEKSGVMFEFHETTEQVGPTTLYVLGAKQLSPTLKQQLGAAAIKKHIGFPKGD